MFAVLPEETAGLRLTEVMAARYSHDLTGPIGAVNNGAEFLQEEEGGMAAQAAELIAGSARQAVSRLQFYRVCYGQKRGVQDAHALQKICQDFFDPDASGNARLTLTWQGAVAVTQERLLANLLLVAAETLLKGGDIRVENLRVTATGAVMKYHESFLECLQGKVTLASLTPKNVQYFWLLMLVKLEGGQLAYACDASQCTLEVRL